MRLPNFKMVALLLLCVFVAVSARAQEPTLNEGGKTHIILLDHSGSMDKRYQTNIREWLIRPLLSSAAFSENDHVVVRWFTQRGRVAFDPADPQVKLRNVKYSEQAVLDNIPGSADLHADTDIPEALFLALKDIEGYSITGDVLIWLITDNDQDSGTSRDIGPLYNNITANKNIRAAYLFPLVKESREQLKDGQPAMIMYLLNYSTNSLRPGLDQLAEDVAKKINNPVITWFPLEQAILPRPDPVEGEDSQVVGDTLVLPSVNEGQSPTFNDIRFAFKSKLRNRSINGRFNRAAKVDISWPASIRREGGQEPSAEGESEEGTPEEAPVKETGDAAGREGESNWSARIEPTTIALTPGQTSSVVYTTSLSSPVTLHPDSFWTAFWSTESEPVNGSIEIQMEDLKTDVQMDDTMLANVKNGDRIKMIVGQSNLQNGSFFIPVSFRVNYDSWSRRLLVIGISLGLLILLGVAGSLALVKTKYELSTPNGDSILTLPIVGKGYVALNGDRAAVISRRFGHLKIRPLGTYSVEGSSAARPISDDGENFSVENEEQGKRYRLSLRRLKQAAPADSPRGGLLD